MSNEEKVIQLFEMKFSVEQMIDIARALVEDDQRFKNLPADNHLKLCLVAINDYADGMECGPILDALDFDNISDVAERASMKAMKCLYLELRARATREHNEELSKKYLAAHQALLKRSFRTMKKDELKIFMDALAS